jgi:hypothetical protein
MGARAGRGRWVDGLQLAVAEGDHVEEVMRTLRIGGRGQ